MSEVTEGPILVRKYGGSSLASVERIGTIARDIAARHRAGARVVVVVSAMGRSTDELSRLARQANPEPPRRELDMLLSVGERITMSLLSMALAAENCPAISYTGSQCGIITDCSHTDARIIEVRGDRVRQSLTDGHVVVVAGFQGVSREKEITTLGRGGSDATAVALAAALGAERCEILKDVDGVMTADPDKVDSTRRHERLDFNDMIAIADAGCGVVHHRAVEYAARHSLPLFVGSSFAQTGGTLVGAATDRDDASSATGIAAAGDACPWRPLVMTVMEKVSRLEFIASATESTDEVRSALASLLRPAAPLAEWFDDVRGLCWGLIGGSDMVAEVHRAATALVGDSGDLVHRRGYGCIGLAGGRPSAWPPAVHRVAEIVAEVGIEECEIRASGSVLRLLVPANGLPLLLDPLHRHLLAD